MLPAGHGPAEPLFTGDTLASVKLRGLLVSCDTDLAEITCTEWVGLERRELLCAPLHDPDLRARLQSLFDARFPPLPGPLEV